MVTKPPKTLGLTDSYKRQHIAKKAVAQTDATDHCDQSGPPSWIKDMMSMVMVGNVTTTRAVTAALSSPAPSTLPPLPPTLSPSKSPTKRPSSPIEVPSLWDWFAALATNVSHNSAKGSEFLLLLEAQDIVDLKDLVDFTAQELVSISGMTIGLAKRILCYAEEDLSDASGGHRSKRSRRD